MALGLVLITFAAYGRIWIEDYQFLNADDGPYVTENPHVRAGLTRSSLWWALTGFHASNWHPLTSISLQLDCQLYGLKPYGFHVTNLVLHAVNAVLLFLLLRRMTGALWRSAIVAGFFAVHPLHVESVAWVSERKDVLSGFFWMLTLWAYAGYAARPGWGRYLLVVLLFALGLMAKPMLVTLPCVLLLLDYWPLKRFGPDNHLLATFSTAPSFARTSLGRLVAEKLPLLLLAAGVCVLTVRAQTHLIESMDAVPFRDRLANSLVAYTSYIRTMFWPSGLALFYPLAREELVFWRVTGAGLFLAAVSLLALANARRRPYLLVGWLWYLGTLAPVIGLVQLGNQARADRYTYLPLIGLFIALTWGIGDLLASRRSFRLAAAAAAGVLVGICMIGTWLQSSYWRDNLALWQRTLTVTKKNGTAHLALALALDKEGRVDEAEQHYAQAIELGKSAAHAFLGDFLRRQGRLREAQQHLLAGTSVLPDNEAVYFNLAMVLLQQENWAAARQQLVKVVQLAPDHVDGHYHLGMVLLQLGDLKGAEEHLRHALRNNSNHPLPYYKLGTILMLQGQLKQAWDQFGIALEKEPRHSGALVGQGSILHRMGQGEKALEYYRRALAVDPRCVEAHFLLALGLKDRGQIEESERHLAAAVELDPTYTTARLVLGRALLRRGELESGRRHFAEAVRRDPKRADALADLAAAYAQGGRFEDAAAAARKGLELAEASQQVDLIKQIRQQLDDYQRRKRP
ncbi:MAG TPA: tetratricopeptide repeat protein [Gemmataceae bacterium]